MLFILLFMLVVCISWQINNITKQTNFNNNRAKEMALSSHDCRDDDEYNGVGFAEIYSIWVTQDAISFGTEPYENL